MTNDMPATIWLNQYLLNKADDITENPKLYNKSYQDTLTKYHRAIVSPEDAQEALAHFANVGWNEYCGLADKQDKEFMDKIIIKLLEQVAK